VDYTTDPLAFIDDDEILPCCTIAVSDITLDI
jgi:ferredoxin